MKLEVGMYVRTKYGISKIEEIKEDKTHKTNWCTVDKAQYHSFLVREQEIIKARHKIINLIEEGDYVNGVRVDEIIYIGHGTIKDLEISFRYKYAFEKDDVYTLKEQDIKSIVTKEQFSQMEYKVGNKC